MMQKMMFLQEGNGMLLLSRNGNGKSQPDQASCHMIEVRREKFQVGRSKGYMWESNVKKCAR